MSASRDATANGGIAGAPSDRNNAVPTAHAADGRSSWLLAVPAEEHLLLLHARHRPRRCSRRRRGSSLLLAVLAEEHLMLLLARHRPRQRRVLACTAWARDGCARSLNTEAPSAAHIASCLALQPLEFASFTLSTLACAILRSCQRSACSFREPLMRMTAHKRRDPQSNQKAKSQLPLSRSERQYFVRRQYCLWNELSTICFGRVYLKADVM